MASQAIELMRNAANIKNLAVRGARAEAPVGRPMVKPRRQPLWDTEVLLAAGTLGINLFVTPQGQQNTAGIAKQAWHTNMTRPGQISSPQTFYLEAISVKVVPADSVPTQPTAANAVLAFYNAVFKFYVGSKTLLRAPLNKMPGGCGLWDNSLVTAISFGIPSVHNVFSIKLGGEPYKITAEEHFHAEIQYPTADPGVGVDTAIQVMLHGVLDDGVA